MRRGCISSLFLKLKIFIMIYLVSFTLGIVILFFMFFLSLFAKSTLSIPKFKFFNPYAWWMLYPSFFFQVYYWTNLILN